MAVYSWANSDRCRIQATWVARWIQAMQLADPPPSPRPTEPVAAPSRRAVQQLTAPGQLDDEQRMSVVAAVHAAALYRVSCFFGRNFHAGGRAMQVATEAGCTKSDESVASTSASAAIIEEK